MLNVKSGVPLQACQAGRGTCADVAPVLPGCRARCDLIDATLWPALGGIGLRGLTTHIVHHPEGVPNERYRTSRESAHRWVAPQA